MTPGEIHRRHFERLRQSSAVWGKLGHNSVTVGDTENFIESKIVEREIPHLKCDLKIPLKPRFEVVLGAEVILPFEKLR